MSTKPSGVILIAILQLIDAAFYILVGLGAILLALASGDIFLSLSGDILLFFGLFSLIIGIIGLILFYGIWKLKSWAWFWALIANIIGILLGITSIATWLVDIVNNLFPMLSCILSIVIVIYLLMPGVKGKFG